MVVRKLVERDSLVPYLNRSATPVNSDYFPYVDLNAGQARYKSSEATMFGSWMTPPLPVIEMLAGDQLRYGELSQVPFLWRVRQNRNALWMYRRLAENASLEELAADSRYMSADMMYLTNLLRDEIQDCVFGQDAARFRYSMYDVMNPQPAVPRCGAGRCDGRRACERGLRAAAGGKFEAVVRFVSRCSAPRREENVGRRSPPAGGERADTATVPRLSRDRSRPGRYRGGQAGTGSHGVGAIRGVGVLRPFAAGSRGPDRAHSAGGGRAVKAGYRQCVKTQGDLKFVDSRSRLPPPTACAAIANLSALPVKLLK